jgi:hypothetical protein
MKDLTNQDFGFLTAIKRVENDKYFRRWLCHCNRCGKDTVVREYSLLNGNTVSCGCYRNDILHKQSGEGLKMVNGTELYHLTGTNAYSNSKTGYRGVIQNQRTGRYIANITISKRMYYLGSFDTPEEAHQAYLAAKEQLHAKVLSDPSGDLPTLPAKPRKPYRARAHKSRVTVKEEDLKRYYKNREAYRGIFYDKRCNRFTVKKKGVYLGCYVSLDDAKAVYDSGEKVTDP